VVASTQAQVTVILGSFRWFSGIDLHIDYQKYLDGDSSVRHMALF